MAARSCKSHAAKGGPRDALVAVMQLVPNQAPAPSLTYSTKAHETAPTAKPSLPSARAGKPWRSLVLVVLISAGGIVVGWRFSEPATRLGVSKFIKARTHSLAAGRGSSEAPAAIVVQLNKEMVRVSSISLGHPRLAVINGETVTEGDNVTVRTPDSSVAVRLRLAKIGDGWIDLTDGKQTFSAKLVIPSQTKPKRR